MTDHIHSVESTQSERDDYVLTVETGCEGADLPVWASQQNNPLNLDPDYPADTVTLHTLDNVPGAFHLKHVFTPEECRHMLEFTERLGFHEDAAISLSRDVRHNQNVVWVADDHSCDLIWRRIAPALNRMLPGFPDLRAITINGRFRFYRYDEGDFFKFHGDGNWPGSRVRDGKLVHDAYAGNISLMSVLVALNSDFTGGATRFRVNADDPFSPVQRHNRVNEVDVYTDAGDILCFPHGYHPQHWMHSGEPILSGHKYILRTDLLFSELTE